MLAGDLRALRNLFRTAAGRRVLIAQALVLVCLVLTSLGVSSGIVRHPAVREAVLGEAGGTVVRGLFAVVLLVPAVFALGMAAPQFGIALFRAPLVPLLLAAPVQAFALVRRAFLHQLFGWTVFALAVGLPPVLAVGGRLGAAPWLLAPAFAAAAVALLAPLLAVLLLVRVAAVRWLAAPRVRQAIAIVHVAACCALVLALVSGFVQRREVAGALAGWLRHLDGLPALLAAPGAWPAAAAGLRQPADLLAAPLLLAAGAVLPLVCAAALYRGAFDRHCVGASVPAARSGRVRGRGWPAGSLRSLLARARLEMLRERASLAFHAFVVALLAVVLAASPPPTLENHLPAALAHGFGLLQLWQGLSLLIASLSFLGVVGEGAPQIALLAASPVPRGHVLLSRAVAVAGPFAVAMLAAALFAPPLWGTGFAGVAVFLAAAPAVVLWSLGFVLWLGTWPAFVRVYEDVPLANNLRSVVPVLLIGAACTAGLIGVHHLRWALVGCHHGHGPLAGMGLATALLGALGCMWLAGGAVFALGMRLGRGNLERLLGPQVS